MSMEISDPAGIGKTVVSPASFPMARVVSSALYFTMAGAWNHQRKIMATLRSARPQLTTGNILMVSYNVLHRWKLTIRTDTLISLQEAYAVTRLSLGMSS